MTYIIIIVLILLSALFSGLTLGLMGLDKYELKRKMELGDSDAKKVYPLRAQGNLLLTTLLVGNVAVNSALSIFLSSIASGIMAGLIATVLIVIFGEIIPQSIFSRFALRLGASVAWLVRFLIYGFYPVCKPIAWLLDKVLGEELPTIYSKQELVKIIKEHEDASMSDVDKDEEKIVTGALTFSDKRVIDIMTPRTVVHFIDVNRVVDDALFNEVLKAEHSRFPVYSDNEDNVVGILHSSILVGSNKQGKQIKDIMNEAPLTVDEEENLDDLLKLFLTTHRHICIVKGEFGGTSGVVTLEDVLEEILKNEIIDEKDVHEDMRKYAKESAK